MRILTTSSLPEHDRVAIPAGPTVHGSQNHHPKRDLGLSPELWKRQVNLNGAGWADREEVVHELAAKLHDTVNHALSRRRAIVHATDTSEVEHEPTGLGRQRAVFVDRTRIAHLSRLAEAVGAAKRISRRTEGFLLVLVLLVLDALAIAAGFVMAYQIRFHSGLPFFYVDPTSRSDFYRDLVFWLIPFWLCVFGFFRLYNRQNLLGGTREYANVVNASTLGMMLVVFAGFVDPTLIIARGWLLIAWIFIIVCVVFKTSLLF